VDQKKEDARPKTTVEEEAEEFAPEVEIVSPGEGIISLRDENMRRQMTRSVTVDEILMKSPSKAIDFLKKRNELLAIAFDAAVARTESFHWVKSKTADGKSVVCTLRAPGAMLAKDNYGIQVLNMRDEEGKPVHRAKIMKEEDGSKTAVIIADGYCPLNSQYAEAVMGVRNSKEKFVGRSEGKAFISNIILENDLRGAAYSHMIGKMVRTLTGLHAVSLKKLMTYENIREEDMIPGYGFEEERKADRAEDSRKITEGQRKRLWAIAYKREKDADGAMLAKDMVTDVLKTAGLSDSTSDIERKDYDAVVAAIESYEVPA
jgi:hypothetical protein